MFGLLLGIVLSYMAFTSFEEVHHMFTLAAFAASIGLPLRGIFFGVWAYRCLTSSRLRLDTGICGEE